MPVRSQHPGPAEVSAHQVASFTRLNKIVSTNKGTTGEKSHNEPLHSNPWLWQAPPNPPNSGNGAIPGGQGHAARHHEILLYAPFVIRNAADNHSAYFPNLYRAGFLGKEQWHAPRFPPEKLNAQDRFKFEGGTHAEGVAETISILGHLDDIYRARERFEGASRTDIIRVLIPESEKPSRDLVEEMYNGPISLQKIKQKYESAGARKLLLPRLVDGEYGFDPTRPVSPPLPRTQSAFCFERGIKCAGWAPICEDTIKQEDRVFVFDCNAFPYIKNPRSTSVPTALASSWWPALLYSLRSRASIPSSDTIFHFEADKAITTRETNDWRVMEFHFSSASTQSENGVWALQRLLRDGPRDFTL
ncbi:major facilitator superfamily domain-containing protein [Apiospora arundinis]